MPSKIPTLSLSHGQVLRAIALGLEPSQRMIDEARYLRTLGIPFNEKKHSTGRGNRRRYDFDDLIELAIAFYYLRHGMKPKDLREYMPKARKGLRELARQTFLSLPDAALSVEWVKSRGKQIPMINNEIFLPFHDRYSETPGKIEAAQSASPPEPGSMQELVAMFIPASTLSNGDNKPMIPLTRLVLETVGWALEVPEVKTGPVTARKEA
jgi:DNA-binding transcriptional MerR regulator